MMKLKIDNVEIECTVQEAVELLDELRRKKVGVPWQGQPYKIITPPDSAQSYRIFCGRTYSPDVTGYSVYNR